MCESKSQLLNFQRASNILQKPFQRASQTPPPELKKFTASKDPQKSPKMATTVRTSQTRRAPRRQMTSKPAHYDPQITPKEVPRGAKITPNGDLKRPQKWTPQITAKRHPAPPVCPRPEGAKTLRFPMKNHSRHPRVPYSVSGPTGARFGGHFQAPGCSRLNVYIHIYMYL